MSSVNANSSQYPLSLVSGEVVGIFNRGLINKLLLGSLWCVLAFYPMVYGWSYYETPFLDRPYAEQHDVMKPSGLIGQGLGIFGTLLILIGVVSYMVRKRWGFMQRFGRLRSWLTFHIFLCTLGPFWVLLHTTFKFGNIAAISFWSMAIVVLSGVLGRYVYVRIPKTINGQFLTQKVLEQAQKQHLVKLAGKAQLDPAYLESLMGSVKSNGKLLNALWMSLVFEMRKGALRKQIDAALKTKNVSAAVRSEIIPELVRGAQLSFKAQVIKPFVRVFGYWHVFHIPLALVMLVALIVHVGVAIAFGYTWIF